jgi:choline dehydrogenase-like flavoprotein
MLLDASGLGPNARFDYCIIGTGPAGLTLALELEATGRRIALLEGGDEHLTPESQALYDGAVVGDPYFALASARVRCFGGTSALWGGWCRPLDPVDFLAKPYCPDTGWPIDKRDLDPYAETARRVLDMPEVAPNRAWGESGLEQFEISVSREKQLAPRFRQRIVASRNIHLVLRANVTSFNTNGAAVTSVNVADYAGYRGTVMADTYVLATGGIENSRLLLWSNVLSNGQLIRRHRTLGRYWMEHPTFTLGEAFTIGDAALDLKEHDSGLKVMFLSPTAQTMARKQILSCGLRLQVAYYGNTRSMIASVACAAPQFGRWLAQLLDRQLICGLRVDAAWEQQPLERNRIELSDELDALGMPKVILHWEKSALDRQTARAAMEVLGEYFAQEDLGRVRIDPWVLDASEFPTRGELAGYHHMGGTRMASNAEQGIVDRNCKVFDQENLYIAGSSVFPTGGHANPTYTIVQLAARLADHLRARA